ncbi:MAG: hypothetical protein IK099_11490 [Clostridia bacterium]|nr:hypothetical protein [Clostridia bacterium]
MKGRKWLVRICAVAVILAIAAVMFVIGRGHTVYFDNKTAEYNGTEYAAFQRVNVFVNGEQAAKLSKRERGMATWIGQNFKMELEITEKKGDEPKTVPVSITLPYSVDGIVVNLPELVAGLPEDAWMSVFVPVPSADDAEDEEIITEDNMGLGDF